MSATRAGICAIRRYTMRAAMNRGVQLTRAGLVVYYAGIGLGCALLFFGGVRLFALLVVSAAQFLGLN